MRIFNQPPWPPYDTLFFLVSDLTIQMFHARSKVVIAPSHKAQEPTAEEWAAAAEYTLTLSLPEGWEQHGKQTTELTLAIDYSGDAARIYYNDRRCIVGSLKS